MREAKNQDDVVSARLLSVLAQTDHRVRDQQATVPTPAVADPPPAVPSGPAPVRQRSTSVTHDFSDTTPLKWSDIVPSWPDDIDLDPIDDPPPIAAAAPSGSPIEPASAHSSGAPTAGADPADATPSGGGRPASGLPQAPEPDPTAVHEWDPLTQLDSESLVLEALGAQEHLPGDHIARSPNPVSGSLSPRHTPSPGPTVDAARPVLPPAFPNPAPSASQSRETSYIDGQPEQSEVDTRGGAQRLQSPKMAVRPVVPDRRSDPPSRWPASEAAPVRSSAAPAADLGSSQGEPSTVERADLPVPVAARAPWHSESVAHSDPSQPRPDALRRVLGEDTVAASAVSERSATPRPGPPGWPDATGAPVDSTPQWAEDPTPRWTYETADDEAADREPALSGAGAFDSGRRGRNTAKPDGGGRLIAFDPGRRGVRALAAVAVVVVVIAAFLAWRARPRVDPVAVPPVEAPATPTGRSDGTAGADRPAARPGSSGAEVVVAVGGKVRKPGLVHLPPGARVADALQAAGGANPGVDVALLNLARKVVDGELIMVGVTPPPGAAAPNGAAGAQAGGAGAPAGGPINLNTATLAELDSLPGVGPVLAQRILDAREAQGGFKAVSDLRKVDGIGDARFEQLKELVTV